MHLNDAVFRMDTNLETASLHNLFVVIFDISVVYPISYIKLLKRTNGHVNVYKATIYSIEAIS